VRGATGGTLVDASGVSMRAATHRVSYARSAAAVRDLGFEMVRSAHDDDGNIVVSPTSLALALAMAREGAGSEAAREIDRLLGSAHDPHRVYNALLHDLANVGKGVELDIADVAFIHDEYAPYIKQPFLESIKSWYGAGVQTTHFPQPGADDVNAWVDEQTKGRISHLVGDLDPRTKVILVNAMYLRAAWAFPFDEDLTTDRPFTTSDGASVDVPTMRDKVVLAFARGPGWQAIRMPYYQGPLSMYVLLPDDGADPADLLRGDALGSAIGTRDEAFVDVSLPRWDTDSDGSLKAMLKTLGLRGAFRSGAFGGVTDDPLFKLDDVVQKANITVTEKGTVAAAATGGIFIATGAPGLNVDFDVDHPFAFAIVHEPTGMPLFEGVVVDPS
jgi:serpin B